jgi:ABC-type transport system involved in cytochrome c biogenesis permease component
MLIGLLAAVAILISTSEPSTMGGKKSGTADEIVSVWIVYDNEFRDIIRDLDRNKLPSSLQIRVVPRDRVPTNHKGELQIPTGESFVELIHANVPDTPGATGLVVSSHYIGKKDSLDTFFEWFWPNLTWSVSNYDIALGQSWAEIKTARPAPPKSLEETSVAEFVKAELIGTVLLLIVQFFCCCHMLVSFTSQDRERGTLQSLVLSPASTAEIMTAKYIFHLILSVFGSVMIVSILKPIALTQITFWVVMVLTSIGLMCVGTCIATLTRTQTSAGLLALCYMLAGAIVFFLATKFSAFAFLKQLTFENYSFPILFRTLKQPTAIWQAKGLVNMACIVTVWMLMARHCFYRYGWR